MAERAMQQMATSRAAVSLWIVAMISSVE
jgi:hypothetical protein